VLANFQAGQKKGLRGENLFMDAGWIFMYFTDLATLFNFQSLLECGGIIYKLVGCTKYTRIYLWSSRDFLIDKCGMCIVIKLEFNFGS